MAFRSLFLAVALPFSPALWTNETFWADGLAEITLFDAREVRYSIPRETEIRHILVREAFAPKELVKADDWQTPGAYNVIKLNQIIRVPTGTYWYDQMHSSFWQQNEARLLKFSLASLDSCGNTYKESHLTSDQLHYRAFTYWEGMSRVEAMTALPPDALFYDELPFRLRTLAWGKTDRFEAPLFGPTVHSKADPLAFPLATFTITPHAAGWSVAVRQGLHTDAFLFDRDFPHGLARWERRDGSRLERRLTRRLPYWRLNRPGDEAELAAPEPEPKPLPAAGGPGSP